MVGFFYGGASGTAGRPFFISPCSKQASVRDSIPPNPALSGKRFSTFIHRKSPPEGGFFLWWSIGDGGQALFHFAMLEASFCAWLYSTEPRPFGQEVLDIHS
jgi:hypothetical protein